MNVATLAWMCFHTVRCFDHHTDPSDYGVDVSFPIQHTIKNTHFATRYDKLMKGCYDKFSRGECEANERARIAMNLRQPATQHNYTEIGFKKTRVPPDVWAIVSKFYEDNKHKEHMEEWPPGNTYTNNWESPTYMISFEDTVRSIATCALEYLLATFTPS